MKLPFKAEKTPRNKREVLLEKTYIELLGQLDNVRTMFDFATDSSMIDALIFEENALLCRLEQIYKDARAEGISLEAYGNRKN